MNFSYPHILPSSVDMVIFRESRMSTTSGYTWIGCNNVCHSPITQRIFVRWIRTLPLEMTAAKSMLDEIHPRLSQPSTYPNSYILSKICGHNVVIAYLPFGVYGTTSATSVISHLISTFPNIRFGLAMGIGGGIPSKDVGIHLM